MKKLLLPLLIIISIQTFGQVKLGVKISPSLVFNRVKADSDSANISKDGMGFRPSFGLIADVPIANNYAFSSGITYISKTVHLLIDPINASPVSQKYVVQYVQIPLTIKLFTNEISIDKKLYFQTGFNAEIQVYNENKTENDDVIDKFTFFDIPLVFAGGAEMNLGVNTLLFFGVSYQRGLINISNSENIENDLFSVKNDLFGFDVGIKF